MATAKMHPSTKSKAGNGPTAVSPAKLSATIQAAVSEAVQRVLQGEIKPASAVEARRGGKAPRPTGGEIGAQIQIWQDDPFLHAVAGADPVPDEPIASELPQDNQPLLQTHIVDPEPDPGVYDPSTEEFLYWNAESAVARGVNYWGPILPNGTVWSTDHHPMSVHLDEGVDFNAFYARESGLNFFHGLVDRVDPEITVFSGASPDVVCHELGHAILDAVKPELFDAMSTEVAAFHEAFGDISSMLCKLQLPALRDMVLQQTGGRLNVNSRLSQLARQLGWAIRVEIDPTAVDGDCLRNTANRFFYQDPSILPTTAPATQLCSEPHSFSRVFSGAFLDVLATMFSVGPAQSVAGDSDHLLAVVHDAGTLLIEGVRMAAVGPGYYSQVAAGMIQADQSLNGGHYGVALTSSFVRRGILSPASAVSLARNLREHGGKGFGVIGRSASGKQLQFEGESEGYKKTEQEAPSLPLRPITTRFGVTLYVHMPAEPTRFPVAAASIAGGGQRILSSEEDAHSFVEDLVQLDRISHEGDPNLIPAELSAPGKASPHKKTHHIVREGGKSILKRHHFDCGFCCHGHRR